MEDHESGDTVNDGVLGRSVERKDNTVTTAGSSPKSIEEPSEDAVDQAPGRKETVSRVESERSAVTSTWNLVEESRLLFDIAIPTIAVLFSAFFIFPQTASLVGRKLGTEELAGFSLASLIGNMTCLSVIIGTLSATETLQPRAFGVGDFLEVGLLAVRGFVAGVLVLIPPVIPLIVCTDRILVALGQDPLAALLASEWVRVYLLGIPSVLIFRCTQRYLACQNIVWPMVYATAFGCFVVHPFLLKFFVAHFGFRGSSAAVVCTQFVQAFSALVYLRFFKPHKAETWPGFDFSFFKEAIRPKPMRQFLKLSVGGVLSFSEWWFWETVCFIAGGFGIIPLCVHTIAYQLVPALFMIPLGLSIGMSVRMGTVLAHDVRKAKLIAVWTMGFTFCVSILLALLIFKFQEPIIAAFTDDEAVIEGCRQIWAKVSIYIVFLYCFGINSGIMRALGLQWRIAAIVSGFTWCTALPLIVHFGIRRGGGLEAVWTIMPCVYFCMNIALFVSYATTNWNEISEGLVNRARRSIAEHEVPDEKTYLLNEQRRQSRSGDYCT